MNVWIISIICLAVALYSVWMLLRFGIVRAQRREPDFIVGGKENPYLLRWYLLPRNRFFNIYYHVFLRSDDDRALHDHMYWNLSIVLSGGYFEHTIDGKRRWVGAGSLRLRRPTTAHRVELASKAVYATDHGGCFAPMYETIKATTLFVTGPRVREWGFLCPQGWRHWKEFVSSDNPGERGKGCD